MPFKLFAIPIYLPSSTSPFDISGVILFEYQKAQIGLRMGLRIKKIINYYIKGLYKTNCYKTKSNFSQFSFSHWRLHNFVSLSLSKRLQIFNHWQAFIVYKNGENLKMLTEIFCQKLIVSNVILAFLDHLKRTIFFVGQSWWPT